MLELARFVDGPLAGMERQVHDAVDYVHVYLGHGPEHPQISDDGNVPPPRAVYRRAGWQGGRAIFKLESTSTTAPSVISPEGCLPKWEPPDDKVIDALSNHTIPVVNDELVLSEYDRRLLQGMKVTT